MKRILIIEDDRFIADVYQAKLQAKGFLVDIANNGRAGLKQFDVNQPDLVLVDLMLPEINGVDVIRSMRARAGNRELPIIVFSNAYLGGMVQEAWTAGASQVLTKASGANEVIKAVKEALRIPAPVSLASAATDADKRIESGVEFLPEISQMFYRNFPQMLVNVRQPMKILSKSPKDSAALQTLCRVAHSIAANAHLAGVEPVAQMAAALESLLKLLWEKPERATVSALSSVGQAISLLENIAASPKDRVLKDPATARVLVVDDDEFIRDAVRSALETVNLTTIFADNPVSALEELQNGPFDLIISDIEMPTADGYTLCTILRGVPEYEMIPIIFLSQHTDSEHRRESFLRGGNDFMCKPFLSLDLAVKALSFVLRGARPSGAPKTSTTDTGSQHRIEASCEAL